MAAAEDTVLLFWYTAADHFQLSFKPTVFVLKLLVQVTFDCLRSTVAEPVMSLSLINRPEMKISSLPDSGTVVTHCPPLNVVEAHVALDEKAIVAFGMFTV